MVTPHISTHDLAAMTLEDLSERFRADAISEGHILSAPEVADLDHDAQSLVLDLLAYDGDHAPYELRLSDIAAYVLAADTGYDDMDAWSDDHASRYAVLMESGQDFPDDMDEGAWSLPARDGSGDYRVMRHSPAR